MLELALIENLQRKDLTPFEESEALHGLAERCGYTHEDLARRLGKSRTLGHRVAGAGRRCPRRSGTCVGWPTFPSKSLLLQVVRQETPEKMTALVEKIASQRRRRRAQQLREATAKAEGRAPEALRVRLPAADQGAST